MLSPNTENFTSILELFDLPSDDEKDQSVLENLKKLAKDSLPKGWENWKVACYDKEVLFGESVDSSTLNKLRFALPTVGIAKAFNPKAHSLPEQVYKKYKLRMLSWPLCVALIIGPPSLSSRIRGSSIHHELVLAAISELKPLLISREKACLHLQSYDEDTNLWDDEEDCSTSTSSKFPKKESRLAKMERDHKELKEMFMNFMDRFPSQPDAMDNNESENDEALSIESSDKEESDIWEPPTSPTSDSRQSQDHLEEELDFKPRTQEIEPSVSAAKHHIEQQGIECQRLGLSSFNKIRYVDAQKKLQASPVFGPLKTNYQLKNLGPKTSVPELLSKMDGSFGTITHGLLLQRDSFSQGIKELVTKFPQIRQEAGNILWGPDSQFKQNSNDLLQFVCGKRAETIELRRKLFRPRNDMVASLLNNIPPSKSHLFEEAELSELFKQHQSSFRPSFRSSKFDTQNKHPQGTFRKPPTHQTGSRPRNFPKTSKDFNKNAPTTSRAKPRDKPYTRFPNNNNNKRQ